MPIAGRVGAKIIRRMPFVSVRPPGRRRPVIEIADGGFHEVGIEVDHTHPIGVQLDPSLKLDAAAMRLIDIAHHFFVRRQTAAVRLRQKAPTQTSRAISPVDIHATRTGDQYIRSLQGHNVDSIAGLDFRDIDIIGAPSSIPVDITQISTQFVYPRIKFQVEGRMAAFPRHAL